MHEGQSFAADDNTHAPYMAVAARRHNLLLIICLCLLLHSVCAASLVPRKAIVSTTSSGNVTVVDSDSREAIKQGAATDGAGDGYSPASMMWMGFGFLVGVPMSFAGIRGWRLTTGVAVAVSLGVLCAFFVVLVIGFQLIFCKSMDLYNQ